MLSEYAKPGSDLYYVLRKVAPSKQEAYLALNALCQNLNHTVENYRDISVAEKKLVWWHDEIERFFKGQANHPILKSLVGFQEQLALQPLQALVEANAVTLKTHVFEARAELLKHYQHLGGIRCALLAGLLEKNLSGQELRGYHELGIVAEVLRHLLQFRHFLQRQHLYFAIEDFQKLKIDPQPVLKLQQLDTLTPLFDEYWHFAKERFAALNLNSKNPLRLEVLLQLKQANLYQRGGWHVFTHQLELSPLRKLFITTF